MDEPANLHQFPRAMILMKIVRFTTPSSSFTFSLISFGAGSCSCKSFNAATTYFGDDTICATCNHYRHCHPGASSQGGGVVMSPYKEYYTDIGLLKGCVGVTLVNTVIIYSNYPNWRVGKSKVISEDLTKALNKTLWNYYLGHKEEFKAVNPNINDSIGSMNVWYE